MLTPFEYQTLAVEQLRCGFARYKRGILVMLMGAGKTFTSFLVIRGVIAKNKRCLFLCDRRMLADQGLERAQQEEIDCGIFMAGRGRDLDAPLQFASKQTLISWVNRGKIELPEFDLIIVDECHRATSEAYQTLIRRWPNAYVIGLTATPCLGNGNGMGAYYDFLVQPIQPSELRAMGRIVKVRAFAPHHPKLDGIKTDRDGDYSRRQLAELLTRENMVGDAPGWWKRYAAGRPSIYFCCTRSHALYVRDQFRAEGISADVLLDDTPDYEREQIQRRLKTGELTIVVTVDVLAEGIDWPFVSCIGLIRPTKRLRRYLQMVGRGLRAHEGKSDMVLIDHAGCYLFHGSPDADRIWPLDVCDNADKRNQESWKKEASTMVCVQCSAIFSGTSRCPECGHVHVKPVVPREIGHKQGTLVEVTTELPSDVLRLAYQRYWHVCIGVAIKRNRHAGMAAGMFHSRYNCAPWEAGVHPMPHYREWKEPAREVFKGFVRQKS